MSDLKNITVAISAEIACRAELLKKELYPNETNADMYRQLILAGLAVYKAKKDSK